MKRVAFFAEILFEDYDGATRTMFQIINRIDRNRFSFLFIYGKGPEHMGSHASLRIPTLNTGLNADYSFSLPSLAKRQVHDALDRFQPDVVHIATPSLLGFFALRYARARGIPVISLYHTNFLSYVPYYFRKFPVLIKPIKNWMTAAMQRFYNQCDSIYVPSHTMQRELKEIGVEEERMSLWQRGINLQRFNPEQRDLPYIQQLTGNSLPNILFASRLVWEKNVQTLIDIYQRLQEIGLPHNFIVVGDGAARADMQEQMPKAIFLGKLPHDKLAKVYASSDIFVFTSVSETYGNVVVEAMASGLPCVIADGGGSADLIRHGHTGYKCLPKSADDYLIYIQLLLSDPALYRFISRTAIDYVQAFDWNALTDRYFTELEDLAQASNSGNARKIC